MRKATTQETTEYLAGHIAPDDAVETEHGLMIPEWWGACGNAECPDCLPRYDRDNNVIGAGWPEESR